VSRKAIVDEKIGQFDLRLGNYIQGLHADEDGRLAADGPGNGGASSGSRRGGDRRDQRTMLAMLPTSPLVVDTRTSAAAGYSRAIKPGPRSFTPKLPAT